jgi:hypothetical protein
VVDVPAVEVGVQVVLVEVGVPVGRDTVGDMEAGTVDTPPYKAVLMAVDGVDGDGGGPITQIVNVVTMAAIAITAMSVMIK